MKKYNTIGVTEFKLPKQKKRDEAWIQEQIKKQKENGLYFYKSSEKEDNIE